MWGRQMSKRTRRGLAACGLVAVAWWQFGVTVRRPVLDGGTAVLQRFFGKTTQVRFFNKEGLQTIRLRYAWSTPFVEDGHFLTALAEGEGGPVEAWHDQNADGLWDTWTKKHNPDSSGGCSIEYMIDTKGTGKPDWVFVRASQTPGQEAWDAIRARRGF